MIIRKTDEKDIDVVLDVYLDASASLRKREIPQWQNGYPNRESLLADMRKGASYVLEEEGRVIGTAAIIAERDPYYDVIENGKWTEDSPYAVIHRIAVLSCFKGRDLAGLFVAKAEEIALKKGFRWLRADTHEKNLSMQRFLQKHGFAACGTVYVAEHAERIAYEKLLV